MYTNKYARHLLRHLCKAEPTNVGFPVNKRHRHPIPADLRGKPLSRSHQKPLDMTMQRQRDVRTTQRVPKDIGTPWSINFLRKYQPNLGRWLTFLQRFQTDHCAGTESLCTVRARALDRGCRTMPAF
jgi:hypothetical protein